MSTAEARDASFRVEMSGTSVRLTGSPQDWARWLDVLTPSAFKALVLLTEPVDEDFLHSQDWEERILAQRGLSRDEAAAGVAELRDKGYLNNAPLRLSDLRVDRSLPPGRPRPAARRCSVCGGVRFHDGPDFITYVAQRGKYLKIGITKDLRNRIATLASDVPGVVVPPDFDLSQPLRLLGTTDYAEHDLHERLSGHHVAGEWFGDSPTLRKALRDLAGVA